MQFANDRWGKKKKKALARDGIGSLNTANLEIASKILIFKITHGVNL